MAKVQVNYKSGISVVMECENFSIVVKASGSKTFEWESASPNPMLLGADDVESVWELFE